MRILTWEPLKRELDACAAFNVALLRAVDPRLITHRPRDPDKARLMAELGIDAGIKETPAKGAPKGARKHTRTSVKRLIDQLDFEVDLDLE